MAYDDALAERLRDRLSGVPTITEALHSGG